MAEKHSNEVIVLSKVADHLVCKGTRERNAGASVYYKNISGSA